MNRLLRQMLLLGTVFTTGLLIAQSHHAYAQIDTPDSSTALTSSSGLTVPTTSETDLTNSSNSFTGNITVNSGALLKFSSASTLGSTANIIYLNAGNLFYNNSSASDTVSQSIVVGSSGATLSSLSNSSSYGIVFSGNISGLSAGQALNIGAASGSVGYQSYVTLNGVNSFIGNIDVWPGSTLAINSDNALGVTVSTNSITGVVTYSPNTSNTLILDGGSLAPSQSMTLYHPLAVSQNGGTILPNGNYITLSSSAPISDYNGSQGVLNIVNSSTNGGTVLLQAKNNVASQAITITGDSLYIDKGTSLTTSSLTVSQGATFGGLGSVNGAVNNQGIVTPGVTYSNGLFVPGTLIITRPYTQTGSLVLGIGANGVHSSLLLQGSTNSITGSILVQPATGNISPALYDLIDVANGTTNLCSITTLSQISLGLTAQCDTSATTGLNILISQNNKIPYYPTIVPNLNAAAKEGAQNITAMVLGHMSETRLAATADDMAVAINPYHRSRTATPYGLWFSPVGHTGQATGMAQAPNQIIGQLSQDGYKDQGYGFIFGYDKPITNYLVGGIAIGVTRDLLSEDHQTASGRIDSPVISLYSSWWRGPFSVDATLGYSPELIHESRSVAGVFASHGTYSATAAMAGMQFAYTTDFDGWAFESSLGNQFLYYTQSEFTEKGTNYYNFSVLSQRSNSMRPYVEIGLSKRFPIGITTAFVPKLLIKYEEELLKGQNTTTALIQGDNYNWHVRGLTMGQGGLNIRANLTLETSKTKSIYLDYDRYQNSNLEEQSISAGMKLRM